MSEQIQNYGSRKLKKEKINGKIYLMASPCIEHKNIQDNTVMIFNSYFKQNKRRCRAVSDHELYIDGKNSLEPDIKILCRENRTDDVPVIVIEVLSKSTRDRDLGVKMDIYAELGIKEYWIITWEASSLDIYLLNDDKRYKLYKSFVYYSSEAELKRLDEHELETLIKEFSPLSFPDLTVKLEDVFDIF